MVINIPGNHPITLPSGQELKLSQPPSELFAGQFLKTVVVKRLTDNQVLLNLNGQAVSAKTTHRFNTGEVLNVKVLANEGATILQVQNRTPSLNTLQAAMLQALPKQAPATQLLGLLSQLKNTDNLPPNIVRQINQLLSLITPLTHLSQHFAQAIAQSGMFWEAALLRFKQKVNSGLQRDFKGQCLQLLGMLDNDEQYTMQNQINTQLERMLSRESLPLPGAIPQPLQRSPSFSILEQSVEEILAILRDQTEQVLSRITANQLNHLTQQNGQAYSLMLDLPIKTSDDVDVVPLMITKEQNEKGEAPTWSVTLALNLTELGEMQAKISLNAKEIDMQVNAEKQNTLNLLEEHQQEIGVLLESLGLNLRSLHLRLGLQENDINPNDLHLLDIRI